MGGPLRSGAEVDAPLPESSAARTQNVKFFTFADASATQAGSLVQGQQFALHLECVSSFPGVHCPSIDGVSRIAAVFDGGKSAAAVQDADQKANHRHNADNLPWVFADVVAGRVGTVADLAADQDSRMVET